MTPLATFARVVLGATALTLAGPSLGAALAKTPVDQLVVGVSLAQVLSLDPGQATEPGASMIQANTYDRLVTTDERNPTKILPQLAERWEITADAITFHLRDAKFQSGNPVTADDVVWSIARVLKMNQASASRLKPYGYTAETIDGLLKAVDAKTVRIGLPASANGEFVLFALTDTVGSVVDKTVALSHQVNGDHANAWLKTNSAGSGPYKLVRWSPNELILLERNDGYWGGKPKMRRALVRHVPESQVQRLLLQQGDIDIASSLAATDLATFVDDKSVTIQRTPTGGFYVLAMNVENPYLAKPDVRRAIAWGIDYAGIAKSILGPYGRVRQMPVPETFPGALPDPGYTLDVAKAKDYLAKAGYPNGFSLTLKTIAETPRVDMATALQASLGQIGIKVTIEQGNGSQIIAAHRGRQFDLLLPQSGSSLPNALGSLRDFVYNPDNSEKGNPGYFAWRSAWDIPDLYKLFEAAAVEKDDGKRIELAKRLQTDFIAAAPAILPMFERFSPVVVSNRVENYVNQGFRGTRFDGVSKRD